jgi:uncharacterized integral membrane protein (TIGR00698 family)
MNFLRKTFFFFVFFLAFSGIVSPPIALALGLAFGLTVPHPYPKESRRAAKLLLQGSVVALGFGMNLHEVVQAGRSGFVYTALGISFAVLVGLTLGKILQVRGNSSYLITAGTAICGGSAIAAIGPILHAEEEEMAVSLGTIFILNSMALLIFPLIGMALHLTQPQFGLWAALAIHDTSSVVGACAKYGKEALVIGTTVKLARALWIVPLALGTAALRRSRSKIQFPWFIVLFVVAAVINTYVQRIAPFSASLFTLGKHGLAATLFLIGTGISIATLRNVGWRPLLQGILLWIVVGATSLYFIRSGFISF